MTEQEIGLLAAYVAAFCVALIFAIGNENIWQWLVYKAKELIPRRFRRDY